MQSASYNMQKDIVVREDRNVIAKQHLTSALYKMNDTTVVLQSGDFELVKIHTNTGQTAFFTLNDSIIQSLRKKYGISDTMFNPDANLPKAVIYYVSYQQGRIYAQCGITYLSQKRMGDYTVNANSHLTMMLMLDDNFQLINSVLFPREEADKFGQAVNTFSFAGCMSHDTLVLTNSSTSVDSMKHITRKYGIKDGKYYFIGYGNEIANANVRNERNVYMVDLCCFSQYNNEVCYTDRGAMYGMQTNDHWQLVTDKGYLLYQAWKYDPANIMYLTFYKGEKTNPDTTVQMKHYNNGTSEDMFIVSKLKNFYAGRMEHNIYRQVVRTGDEIHYQEYKIEVHEKH